MEIARLAKEGRFDYWLIESTGISEPLPVGPGLFVSGPLADLELGPAARNIAGARAAAERILSAA